MLNLCGFCHSPTPTFGSFATTCTLLFSVHVMLVVALTDSWWKVALFCLFMLSAAKKRRNFFIIHNTEPELELWKVLVSLQCGGCFWVCISKGVKSTCALVCWGLCLCLIEQHCSCSHSHLSVISFNSTPTFTCSCYFLKKSKWMPSVSCQFVEMNQWITTLNLLYICVSGFTV